MRRALGALLHDAQRGLDAGVPVRMVAQVALHLGARLAAACRHTRNLARDEGEERHEVGLDVVGLAYAGTGRRTLSGRSTAGIAARAWWPDGSDEKPSVKLELVCNPIWLCVQLDLDTPK